MGYEECLILAVEKHPVLYDKSLTDYKNGDSREDAWKLIGKELKEDREQLKRRWRTLRDTFMRNYRLSNKLKCKTNGTGSKKKIRWPHFNQMLFLVPHIQLRETSESYSDEEQYVDLDKVMKADPDDFHVTTSIDTSSYSSLKRVLDVAIESSSTNEDFPKKKYSKYQLHSRSVEDEDKLKETIIEREDPDEMFMLSCVPILKRLSPKKNMLARLKIQTLLYQLEFDNESNNAESNNANEGRDLLCFTKNH